MKINVIVLQLSGRAGRNNGQSLCVLYYNAKQKVKDTFDKVL